MVAAFLAAIGWLIASVRFGATCRAVRVPDDVAFDAWWKYFGISRLLKIAQQIKTLAMSFRGTGQRPERMFSSGLGEMVSGC
jgi:hypothetical protein